MLALAVLGLILSISDDSTVVTDRRLAGVLLIAGEPARIVGGQGFLFGRGNQQISAKVIAEVGVENIVIVSSLEKLVALPGNCLLVDTGDESVDDLLAGYLPVIVSDAKTVMMPVKNAANEVSD